MPDYKVSWFFKQRTYGWSETFYITKANSLEVGNAVAFVIAKRVAMLGGAIGDNSSPYLSEIRVSDVAIQRDSRVLHVSPADGAPANPVGFADNPNLAILLDWYSGDLYRRQQYLRGNPDSLVAANGIKVPLPVWDNLFTAWKNIVIAQQFGILATTRPPEATAILIENFVYAVDTPVQMISTAPHGLVDQDTVRIINAPGTTGLRGSWVVKVVNPTTVSLLGTTGLHGAYKGGGKFYKKVFTVKPFTKCDVVEATHRITGSPFDRPRGRRKRRVPA
jgi:hypothetical protein